MIPPLLVIAPCVIPSLQMWAGTSDFLLIDKIYSKGNGKSHLRLGYQKMLASILFALFLLCDERFMEKPMW